MKIMHRLKKSSKLQLHLPPKEWYSDYSYIYLLYSNSEMNNNEGKFQQVDRFSSLLMRAKLRKLIGLYSSVFDERSNAAWRFWYLTAIWNRPRYKFILRIFGSYLYRKQVELSKKLKLSIRVFIELLDYRILSALNGSHSSAILRNGVIMYCIW